MHPEPWLRAVHLWRGRRQHWQVGTADTSLRLTLLLNFVIFTSEISTAGLLRLIEVLVSFAYCRMDSNGWKECKHVSWLHCYLSYCVFIMCKQLLLTWWHYTLMTLFFSPSSRFTLSSYLCFSTHPNLLSSTCSCRDLSDYLEFSGSGSADDEYLPIRRRSAKLNMTRLDPPPHRPNPRAWMDEARSRDSFTSRSGTRKLTVYIVAFVICV